MFADVEILKLVLLVNILEMKFDQIVCLNL